MNRVFVTGDTHGLNDFGKLKRFNQVNKLDRMDYIIIAGDAGIVWSRETLDDAIREYESLGCTVLFVDGNHENFDMLERSLNINWWHGGKVHQISDNIFHLQRGEIFFLHGKSILALGGGESIDKCFRQENKSWWSGELITQSDCNNAITKLHGNNRQVDYIISHTPPNNILSEIYKELTQCWEDVPDYMDNKLKQTESGRILSHIAKHAKFSKWYFGHLHIDMEIENYRCLYDDIVELK